MSVEEYKGNNVAIDDCECVGETAKAILVQIPDIDEPMWMPKTQIHDDSDVYENEGTGTLIVSRWIATQKDIL